MGIINTPKSITIRVLHSFGVGTNFIGGYYTISVKRISLAGNVSSAKPPQAMVLPRKVFHKTYIRVSNQDDFERKLINTQSLTLFKIQTSPIKGSSSRSCLSYTSWSTIVSTRTQTPSPYTGESRPYTTLINQPSIHSSPSYVVV